MYQPNKSYDGVPTLIDFKSSRKKKTEQQIGGYYRQTTLYQMMFEEMTGIRLELGCIIMGVDEIEPGKVGSATFDVIFGDHRKTVIDEVCQIQRSKGIIIDVEECYDRFL